MIKHPLKPYRASYASLFLLLGLVPLQESRAALITYSFEGNVTGLSGSGPHPFTVGQSMSGSFTYDTSTVNVSLDPISGQYNGAVTQLSLSFGSYSVTGGPGDIQVGNTSLGDVFSMGSPTTGLPLNGSHPFAFTLSLQDFSGLALDSTALGPLPPSSAFGTKWFTLRFTDDAPYPQVPSTSMVAGNISSVTPVPLPSGTVLFSTGLSLCLSAFRRLRT